MCVTHFFLYNLNYYFEQVFALCPSATPHLLHLFNLFSFFCSEFITTNIFIAAGGGSFEPRRPPNIEDPDRFIGKGVSYSVRNKEDYKNKDLLIFGGGDSALDWTVELAQKAKEITLIHRTTRYRAAPHTVNLATENSTNNFY